MDAHGHHSLLMSLCTSQLSEDQMGHSLEDSKDSTNDPCAPGADSPRADSNRTLSFKIIVQNAPSSCHANSRHAKCSPTKPCALQPCSPSHMYSHCALCPPVTPQLCHSSRRTTSCLLLHYPSLYPIMGQWLQNHLQL